MKYPVQYISMLIIALVLSACELAAPPPPTVTPLPTPTLPPLALAVDVLDDAIIVPIPIDPPSFNAYLNDTGFEALVGELVYGALAEIGPDGNYYPELAVDLPTLANGGLSQDGLTVTWRLKPEVKWSDGQPFTSADVRFTWQSFRDSGIWAPGMDLIEDVETPDPQTAVVHYRQFYPNYLIQFGGLGTGVFPAHYCGPTNQMLFWDCNLEPISTGPFVLDQWIRGTRLTFAPNPNYFVPGRPLAKQLVFQIQPNADFRARSLERGNVHLDLWPEEPALTRLQDSDTVRVVSPQPARFVLRLVPNLSAPGSADPAIPHPALADARVREAIRYAVDVGRLNEEAFAGRGIPIDSELSQFGCQLPTYNFNPGQSSVLLDEAGWKLLNPEEDPVRTCQGCGTAKDGTRLILQSYIYEEFGDELVAAHRLIQEMLAEVGIKLERKVVEGGQLWNTWENNGIELRGNFDLDLWDDGYYGVDPTLYLSDYFDPRSIPTRDNPVAGLNVSRYRNQTLADIFDALHTPLPNNRRRSLICEVAIILHQDLPQMPLLALPERYGISANLQGVLPNTYDTITWNAQDWSLVTPPQNQ
ncbi:MAG: ABC transporter substrate-binding protein [Anaerolineae bacterium]